MSLNFSYAECIKNGTMTIKDAEYTDQHGDTQWSPLCYVFPFQMMAIGMGSVTEKNIGEVWRRICIHQRLHGPLIRWGGEEFLITERHLQMLIGFRCNVGDDTPAEFNKRVLKFPSLASPEVRECSECGTIAHGLREDGRCPNCNPMPREEND